MIAGAAMRARLNASLSAASPSPTYWQYSCAHDSARKVAPLAVAAARASVVLEQPVEMGAGVVVPLVLQALDVMLSAIRASVIASLSHRLTRRSVQQHAPGRREAQPLEGGRVLQRPLHRLAQTPLHLLQPANVLPAAHTGTQEDVGTSPLGVTVVTIPRLLLVICTGAYVLPKRPRPPPPLALVASRQPVIFNDMPPLPPPPRSSAATITAPRAGKHSSVSFSPSFCLVRRSPLTLSSAGRPIPVQVLCRSAVTPPPPRARAHPT